MVDEAVGMSGYFESISQYIYSVHRYMFRGYPLKYMCMRDLKWDVGPQCWGDVGKVYRCKQAASRQTPPLNYRATSRNVRNFSTKRKAQLINCLPKLPHHYINHLCRSLCYPRHLLFKFSSGSTSWLRITAPSINYNYVYVTPILYFNVFLNFARCNIRTPYLFANSGELYMCEYEYSQIRK